MKPHRFAYRNYSLTKKYQNYQAIEKSDISNFLWFVHHLIAWHNTYREDDNTWMQLQIGSFHKINVFTPLYPDIGM